MESLIQKELDRFNNDLKEIIEFKRTAKNLTDDYFYQGKEEAYKEIISFLESIKNLPNELKGVSNNELAHEFLLGFKIHIIPNLSIPKGEAWLLHHPDDRSKNGDSVR